MQPIRHDLFAISTPEEGLAASSPSITCTCGETKYLSTTDGLVRWFGAHCYSAALDRAIEIIKS